MVMNLLQTLFRQLSIRNRLMFGYLLLFLLVLNIANLANYVLMRDLIEKGVEKELTTATESITDNIATTVDITIRNYLRGISELSLQYVEQQYRQFQLGNLSEQEAKQRAATFLLEQKIGATGYSYVVDSEGIIRVHPKDPLIDMSLMKYEFIQKQVAARQGYLEYQWKNPDELVERPKALYMVYFEPWDWIITSSSYREEFASLVDIEDFSESISKLHFDETGYSYVLNDQGDAIVHPYYDGNFYNIRDSRGQLFVQQMLKEQNGTIKYTWKNPQEPEHREKIAVFRYLPEYKWYIVSSTYVQELNQPLFDLKVIHAIVLLVSILLIVPSNLLLSRSIVLPLKNVMQWISKASNGNYSVRVEDHSGSNDELAQLANYFNHFLSELEKSNQELYQEIQERVNAQSKLENLNETLEDKVAQRTLALEQSMEQLKRTQEQLIESEKLSALGGLVAGIAHEVNTPLGIAITSSSLIHESNTKLKAAFEAQSLTSEQFDNYVTQQAQAIELLTDNLNRASKLVQSFKQTAVNQVSEDCTDFEVNEVLQALLASLHPETHKAGVEPRLIVEPGLTMFSLSGALTQVFSHLILNSVHHAFDQQADPKILIDVQLEEDEVVFRFEDNGCGVEPEIHKKIFEPFYTSRRARGGMGIGLNLVFNLVTQKLKGTLEFASSQGVSFTIRLPKRLP